MSFRKINKAEYKSRLNRSQLVAAVSLLVLSLILSELLRAWISYGDSAVLLNAAAVGISVIVIIMVFLKVRRHPYFTDIMYIWDLKQQMNAIYRHIADIENGLKQDNLDAILCQYFYLHASIYVYRLEDNTLTLSEISREVDQLNDQIERLDVNFSIEDYHPEVLKRLVK